MTLNIGDFDEAGGHGATITAAGTLREISDATFRQLLDAAPDAVIVVDRAGEIVMVNLQVERFFGYRREDLLGRKIECLIPERFRLVHPGHRSAFFDRHNVRTMGAGIDLYALRRDGTEFPVEISLSPLETEHGLLVSCAIRDVTLRKTAEEHSRRRDEIFQLMVANIRDYGIIMLDPEGCVASWNAGALAITGYPADEIIGKHFSLFYTKSDIASGKPERELDSANSTGRFTDAGWRVRKDGTRFWARVVVTPLRDPSGNLLGFAKVTRDISERRQAADLDAAKTSELVVANKELEAFAYSVSHDLRAPLRHMDGFAELLRKNCYQQLDAQGRRYLDKITASAQRMGLLIDDLLTFSRLLRADISRTQVSIRALLDEVRRELEPDLAGRTVVWTIADLPDVYGDRSMLRQVFVNLLSNAVKYTRDRRPAHIEIGYTPLPEEEIAIFVRDNGAGFEMQYVHKLFQVFQRLHSDEFEGTGVGLANVRRIVERHGGRVWAEGEVDRGATFSFSLPTNGEKDHA